VPRASRRTARTVTERSAHGSAASWSGATRGAAAPITGSWRRRDRASPMDWISRIDRDMRAQS
jgi:hypothetical protein